MIYQYPSEVDNSPLILRKVELPLEVDGDPGLMHHPIIKPFGHTTLHLNLALAPTVFLPTKHLHVMIFSTVVSKI